MKWLKRKLVRWINEVEREDYGSTGLTLRSEECKPDEDPILTFRIYSAANGKVLEFRRYDRKTDRNDISTHIIGSDVEIGDYVNKCLSMELLKQ